MMYNKTEEKDPFICYVSYRIKCLIFMKLKLRIKQKRIMSRFALNR